ncbi:MULTISPECIES: (Na+)-NQR maturation NqrM [Thalassotalea]|uniref:(Na+)-NQR maturation NqrM n=1 Tax=Thalassotalea castellviae TaxID=3075612 RepID=A0ABU3A0H7_9GAMM|nr:(Na+)-NQR maturation NqrM [Thalassotalea sp. W431]MDT0603681.1 (Na+)-NQR maturation NqrM [Thalassotalea sp. W431]
MMIFLVTLVFFLIIAAGMAVGYIFQQKTLAGSCGGLGSVGIEKACNCDSPCEKRQERERIAAQERDNHHSINVKNI